MFLVAPWRALPPRLVRSLSLCWSLSMFRRSKLSRDLFPPLGDSGVIPKGTIPAQTSTTQSRCFQRE